MNVKSILNFRNAYEDIFTTIRRVHMKRLVTKLKKSTTDKYVLTKENEKAAKSFWKQYKAVPMLYHNFYTEKHGKYYKEYIPDEIYYNYIQPYFNNYRLSKALDNKCYYHKMFQGIPQPKLVAYRLNNFWYIDDEIATEGIADVFRVLQNETEVFVKRATDCGGGHGVTYLKCQGLTIEAFEKLIRGFSDDIAIQRGIKQHSALAKINPSSVNTIRLITLLEKDSVCVLSPILRMGVGDTKVDNCSSGGMTIGVTLDGKLKKYACANKRNLVTQHPTSNVIFEGYPIPSFDRVKAMVLQASYMVPHFRMVSWDVSVLEDGTPILIEANLYDGQLDFHQIHNGPLFGEQTERILDEVFKHK